MVCQNLFCVPVGFRTTHRTYCGIPKNSPPEPDKIGGETPPEHLSSLVLKKSLVKRGVIVGLDPGVMPNAGVNGEPHVAATGPQGVNHPLAHFQLDSVVFRTVKGPDRNVFELTGKLREATATNGGDGCEQLRVSRLLLSSCPLIFIRLYQHFCRDAKPCVEPPYHVYRKRSFSAQYFRNTTTAANVRLQVTTRQATTFHVIPDGFDRVRQWDGVVLIFVSFNQRGQYFQPVTFGRIGRGVKKAFYFFQSGLIVHLGFDGPNVHSRKLLSNRGNDGSLLACALY